MWRKGAISIRNKYGIYRSFGRNMDGVDDRPTNGIKDETLQLAVLKSTKKIRTLSGESRLKCKK